VKARVMKHFVGYTQTKGASLSSMGLVRKRTGHLIQSTAASDAMADRNGWYATVGFRKGSVDAYAKAVEEGADFTPSKKLLAIPVGPALTPSGVARYRSPLDVADGFWAQTKGGTGMGFFVRIGKRLQMLFIGRKHVKVPAFRPLQRSLDGARPQFAGIFTAEADKAIRSALGG
jgi:hypothetical protein